MPTVHADCQASVDGRDLSRSVTEGLPGEVAPRFVASFADFLTDTLETGGKDLSGNMLRCSIVISYLFLPLFLLKVENDIEKKWSMF